MMKRMFFVLAALLLAGSGWYFRQQNAKMAQAQANQIVRQDVLGQDTTTARDSLKTYVQDHMGANVKFTLAAGFARAEAAAKVAAVASAANSQIYAAAQAACAGKSDSITQARCNQDYLSKHLANVPAPAPVVTPKLADFQYHYQSPVWTPDLAGSLFAGTIAALAVGAFMYRRSYHP